MVKKGTMTNYIKDEDYISINDASELHGDLSNYIDTGSIDLYGKLIKTDDDFKNLSKGVELVKISGEKFISKGNRNHVTFYRHFYPDMSYPDMSSVDRPIVVTTFYPDVSRIERCIVLTTPEEKYILIGVDRKQLFDHLENKREG